MDVSVKFKIFLRIIFVVGDASSFAVVEQSLIFRGLEVNVICS